MTVIDLRYLTLVIPYQVGTMSRRGKPWCGNSGWPLASQARITPSASASLTGRARSKWCRTPRSKPWSWPVKTASTAASSRPPEVEAVVMAGKDPLHGVVAQPGRLEQRAQRRAAVLVDAHRLVLPGDV